MITRLRIRNFRRFIDETIMFGDGISYIEGKNNAGKTTIFLAIEYAFFGTVSGFRSQAALMHPGTTTMGVEIYYRGKNGREYKLQRLHEKKGRGATGHYTLKEVEEDGQESYITSSDFANASEEVLQLQIFETLGISKRLFDVAINIRQGEITSILEGNKLLDIVLGVSAAVMARKQLNSVALSYEKETSQYPTLQTTLQGYTQEQQELEKQQSGLEEEISELQDRKDTVVAAFDCSRQDEKLLEPVMGCYRRYHQHCQLWDRALERLQDQIRRYQKMADDAGELEEIEETIEKISAEIQSHESQVEDIVAGQEVVNKQVRALEQTMGDLKGKIQRRKDLPKGEVATCEECGAQIDQKRVQKELNQWLDEKQRVSAEIQSREEEIRQLKTEISSLNTRIRDLTAQRSEKRELLKQLRNAAKEEQVLIKRLQEENETLLTVAVDLYDELQQYNDNKDESDKISIPKPELMDLDTEIDLPEDVIMARSMDQTYTDKLQGEAQKLQKITSEAKIEVRVISDQLDDRTKQKSNLKPRLSQLNMNIAQTKKQLEELERKKVAAERMRTSAGVFKKLQESLRDQAASSLAQRTLKFHEQLAETREYHDLTVDPKNYRIYVKPDDIGEEVPAHSYQGGGHKLLLSIAFKLAIIELVTKPPFILLDEPTYGLDTTHKTRLFAKIDQIVPGQLLLITHQRQDGTLPGDLLKVIKNGATSKVEVIS